MGRVRTMNEDSVVWEVIETMLGVLMHTERMKVPGGWIVRTQSVFGIAQTFIPDPEHKWNLEDFVVK